MAIATRDYGLFIGGESVEGAETRELAEARARRWAEQSLYSA